MEDSLFNVKLVGIIFDTTQRKILVGKRKGDKEYSFVEGNLSHETELDKCLKKMIKEKTGYKVHNLGSIFAENALRDKMELKLYFLCERGEGKEKPEEGVIELTWIDPCKAEKIMNVKFPTRLREFIKGLGISCDLQ